MQKIIARKSDIQNLYIRIAVYLFCLTKTPPGTGSFCFSGGKLTGIS